MSNQVETLSNGQRTIGVRMFYESLPDHIVPQQKAVPPYMPYTEGYGYLGVVLLDTEKDQVQCHMCGRWFKAVNGKHLGHIHKISTKEYKIKTGLYQKEPLMCHSTIALWRSKNKRRISRKNLAKGREFNFATRRGNNNGSQTVQWKNKYGTCDAQLRFRLDEAIKKYGRVPIREEVQRLASTFDRRYGSWEEGLEIYGHQPYRGERGKYIPENDISIAPQCKVCGVVILRKQMPNGDWQDRERWLSTKTCSPEHKKEYLAIKWPVQACAVKDCQLKYKARGYCNSHYLQIVKRGRNRGKILA